LQNTDKNPYNDDARKKHMVLGKNMENLKTKAQKEVGTDRVLHIAPLLPFHPPH
jgi:hypothetical protein